MKSLKRLLIASLVILVLAAAAWSQDQAEVSSSDTTQDPPGRVARLQYMTGEISVQPHGVDDWVRGEANRPLTNADNVWADKDSRAELNLGTGLMRINSETSLTLTNINNDAVQVSLHQGALNVHLRRLYEGEVWEIDTPNLAFTVSKSGDYRFDVDPNGDTTLVTVWKGEGEATGQGPAVPMHEGEQVQFTNGTSLAHESRNAPQRDGFDEWCRVRDQREDQSVSAKYVAPGVVGYEDLDEYGTWRNTPDYGPVWVPTTVYPGWAPYSAGNWIWEDPWGWTWVDAYPWGFAPFHYGRWVHWGGYWGWAPGPYWVRPWYAPALVAWFGGPHWGVGFGFGGVGFGFGGGFGWCPLGFREPFFPWYHVSRGYFRNVNISNTRITNITNVTNNYFNHGRVAYGTHNGLPQFASTAGRAMSRDGFANSRPVSHNSVRLSANQLRGASALNRVDASPTRTSMLGARTGQPAARPSQSAFSRPTFNRMTPPASTSRSFARPAGNIGNTAARNGLMNRGPQIPSGRTAGNGAFGMSSPAPAGRYVPRPPQSLGRPSVGAATPERSINNPGTAFGRNVPRPNSTAEGASQVAMNHSVPRPAENDRSVGETTGRFQSPSGTASPASRSVPRPPAESGLRSAPYARNTGSAMGSTNSAPRPAYNGGYNNVPRPSGRVMAPPREYSGAGGGSYSSRAYGSYGGYGSSPHYGGSPYRGPSSAYGGYGSRGTYSAPSHSSGGFGGSGGRGGYSAPSHSSGGFGGYRGGGGSSGFHSSGGSSRGGHR